MMTIELLLEQPGHMVRLGSLVETLRANVDLFAWKPEDMKRIGPEVAIHKLNINPNAKPIKQKRRHFEEQKMKSLKKKWRNC